MPRTKASHDAQPVTLDQYSRRNDADVLQGHFCRIESGDHRNEIGVFTDVVECDKDGYPSVVSVQLRNSGVLVVADYDDLTPVEFGGR